MREIVEADYNLSIPFEEEKLSYIQNQDSMLFRQVRLITNYHNQFNPYVVFVDCVGFKDKDDILNKIIKDGFSINNQKFVISEKSASMSRYGILGFIDESISYQMNEVISMGLNLKNTIIPKYLPYRGLMFSSCHCIEGWLPKIIVVDDYSKIIHNQNIRYATDREMEYTHKDTGEVKKYTCKVIEEGWKDISIEPFDGAGLHHPEITGEAQKYLNIEQMPTSIMWRLPFVKGVTHDFNYTIFFIERDIETITDIWGESHSVYEPMIILTKSMYKGYGYFNKYGDVRDWDTYWDRFKKYNHCIGISKWNFSIQDEKVYTRVNYQILQDLDLDYDDFIGLVDESLNWTEKIINGDKIYTYCFLGLFADSQNPSNNYMKAILKNPMMLKEECVRSYIVSLLKKTIDQFKCGKLWLKSTFRIITPDLVALAEYIGGLEPAGCLKADEFYSRGADGVCGGEHLIERNPHICKSEHAILTGVDNNLIFEYCSHLEGIVMVNCHSLILQRLNGADVDGDLALVIKNDIMMQGVDRNSPIVIDIEDKATIKPEEINSEAVAKSIIRSLENRIGEYSNVASAYHNKRPQSEDQKKKYMDYIDLVSILNGKEIDAAKTGIRYNLPRHISKYSKPLPYFMKYAGKYYKKLKKFNRASSNMNRLCFELERWEKKVRFKRKYKEFDYNIMLDESILFNELKYNEIKELYIEYNKEISDLRKQSNMSENCDNYKNYFGDLSRFEVLNSRINWNRYYEKYINRAKLICPNEKELANLCVKLMYEEFSNRDKKFMWTVAGDGILQNIRQVEFKLPIQDEYGEYEYLGKRYKSQSYGGGIFAE